MRVYVPFVASEARKLSWPEPNAGWIPGRPPSVPTLSMLYLCRIITLTLSSRIGGKRGTRMWWVGLTAQCPLMTSC